VSRLVSRLLAVICVGLVGVALAVVLVNLPTDGGGAGQPAHVQEERIHAGPPPGAPAEEPSEAPPVEDDPQLPRTLVISSLGVRAPVVPLEMADRTLYPPDDPSRVGWWRDGAMPGSAQGSTIVTGHTVSDGDGVFDDLDRLARGERVRLVTDEGVLRYVVRRAATYRKNALARRAERLFSQTSPGRLVLVTCEDWNGEVYLSNHVVIAEPA
jgi:LPXTG-site transpeptidase (sortase) family protein